mgnify:FL=1
MAKAVRPSRAQGASPGSTAPPPEDPTPHVSRVAVVNPSAAAPSPLPVRVRVVRVVRAGRRARSALRILDRYRCINTPPPTVACPPALTLSPSHRIGWGRPLQASPPPSSSHRCSPHPRSGELHSPSARANYHSPLREGGRPSKAQGASPGIPAPPNDIGPSAARHVHPEPTALAVGIGAQYPQTIFPPPAHMDLRRAHLAGKVSPLLHGA